MGRTLLASDFSFLWTEHSSAVHIIITYYDYYWAMVTQPQVE